MKNSFEISRLAMKAKIKCFEQNTVLAEIGDKKVYFECSSMKGSKKADIILLSGSNKGFNLEALKKKVSKNTVIFCPASTSKEIESLKIKEIKEISPNEEIKFENLTIKAIPAHKIDRLTNITRPIYNGYTLKNKETKEIFYFSGPTDLIPEMNLIESDVTFITVDGDGMDLFEALAASNVIYSKLFVPIAYSKDLEEGIINCNRFKLKCNFNSELLR